MPATMDLQASQIVMNVLQNSLVKLAKLVNVTRRVPIITIVMHLLDNVLAKMKILLDVLVMKHHQDIMIFPLPKNVNVMKMAQSMNYAMKQAENVPAKKTLLETSVPNVPLNSGD
jgi:7-cyano-7-deazaguanine synthase in queuosine biosynthesis